MRAAWAVWALAGLLAVGESALGNELDDADAARKAGHCREALALYKDWLELHPGDRRTQEGIGRCRAAVDVEDRSTTLNARPKSWTSDAVGHTLVLGGLLVGIASFIIWDRGRSEVEALNASNSYIEFEDRQAGSQSAFREEQAGLVGMVVASGLIAGGITHYVTTVRCQASSDSASLSIGGRF